MKERSQRLNPLSFITFSQASEKNSYLKNIFIVIENIVFEFAKRQINQSTVEQKFLMCQHRHFGLCFEKKFHPNGV